MATAPQAEEHLEQRHIFAAATIALVVEPIDRVLRAHVCVARVAERHEVPRLLRVLAVRPALGIGDDVRRVDIGRQQWRQHRWRELLRQAAQARVLDQRPLLGAVFVHIEARPHRAAELAGDRRPLILCLVRVRKGTPRAFAAAAGLEYAVRVEYCALGHDSNARLVLVVLEQVLKEVVSHATHDLGCLNRGEGNLSGSGLAGLAGQRA